MTPDQTMVIFREFKDGCPIAIFPEEPYPGALVMSYSHGFFSGANLTGIMSGGWTRPASEENTAKLRKELEDLGYVLKVRLRSPH